MKGSKQLLYTKAGTSCACVMHVITTLFFAYGCRPLEMWAFYIIMTWHDTVRQLHVGMGCIVVTYSSSCTPDIIQ